MSEDGALFTASPSRGRDARQPMSEITWGAKKPGQVHTRVAHRAGRGLCTVLGS